MDFERQKPVTDEYREGWERIFGQCSYSPYFGELRPLEVYDFSYLNGCPILTEERVDG